MPLNDIRLATSRSRKRIRSTRHWLDADTELVVLAVRIVVYRGLQKWELMREIAKRLVEWYPQDSQWVVSWAYATRRAVSIEFPRDILLAAKPIFPQEPMIPFYLACYASQLGGGYC
jgi:hypothetical protein